MQGTIRLTKRLKEILGQYSDDASTAIKEMDIRIMYLQGEVSKLKSISDTLQKSSLLQNVPGHDKRYWDELKERVREAIMEMQG